MVNLSSILINYGQEVLRKPRLPKERHWPSDAGKCIRALVYQWRGEVAKQPDGRLFFIFNDGELHHKALLEQLERAGIAIHMKEAPLRDPGLNISGKMDALIKMDGHYYVLEIKSINRYGFEEVKRDGPKEEHIIQLQLYLYYVQNLFKIETKCGIILYKCKDTSRFADFLIDYNENMVQDFFGKLKVIENHLACHTLPDRPYESTSWQCRYCEYHDICWMSAPASEKIVEITEEALTNLIGELIWVKEQRREYEQKEEILTEEVKKMMEQKHIDKGTIESYLIELKETKMRRLDQKALIEGLGEEQLKPYYRETIARRLNIKEF